MNTVVEYVCEALTKFFCSCFTVKVIIDKLVNFLWLLITLGKNGVGGGG